MYVEHYVGTLDADAGSTAVVVVVAEPVDDSIFHPVGDELRIAEFVAVHRGVDGECLVLIEQRTPVEALDGLIEAIGIGGAECIDRF